MIDDGAQGPRGERLTGAISAAMVDLYAQSYGHDRTTATTYVNDNVLVCVLEGILSAVEAKQIAQGHDSQVIDGRVAFQERTEDEFTAAIERLTHRRVTAFLSANQTHPGVACELFFLEAPPVGGAYSRHRPPPRVARLG
jgi:uncharacterized protein YbcI